MRYSDTDTVLLTSISFCLRRTRKWRSYSSSREQSGRNEWL